MPVYTPRKEHAKASRAWSRCRDTYDGSDAIKDKGDVYLPRLDAHQPGLPKAEQRYKAYKDRAIFYNAMGRTVDGLSGLIMQKPPKVEATDDVKNELKTFTQAGAPFESFALDVTKEVVKVGRVGILVDMPELDANTTPTPENTPRPYGAAYKAEDILNWREEVINGRITLTRVVLREDYEYPDDKDQWVTKCEDQYRVLELTDGVYTQSVWRKKAGEYSQIPVPTGLTGQEATQQMSITPTRRGDPLPFIPFLVVNPTSVGMNVEKPPLDDMAQINVSHYQGSADIKHGLHLIALPTPYITGKLSGSGKNPEVTLGPGVMLEVEKGGSVGMLEYGGSGMSSYRLDQQDMEKQMASLGARLIESGNTAPAETATSIYMRHSGDHATVRTIANNVEMGLTIALQWFVWWESTEETPDDVDSEVELNKDYFATKMTPAELSALLGALQAEKISYETFYAQLVAGQIARPGVSAEQEREQIEKEAPEPLDVVDPEDPNAPNAPDPETLSVKEQNGKYQIVDQNGKVVSTHASPEEADAQIAAMREKKPAQKPPQKTPPPGPPGRRRFGG